MAYKSIEKSREYRRTWYNKNKSKAMGKIRERKRLLASWVTELKSNKECVRCGESDIACLDFHHIESSKKDLSIARAITNGWSKERILAEINKCEVLCANCHRKLHYYGSLG